MPDQWLMAKVEGNPQMIPYCIIGAGAVQTSKRYYEVVIGL